MNRTRDAHVEGQGRGLVAARDLGRGEVVLRDVALAVGANEVDLLRNCFAAAPARRCIDDELCSLSYESLDVNARTSLADTISGVNDLLDFFAPFASDVGDGEQFDDGSDASWARRASLRLECNVFTLWTAAYERRAMGLFPLACRLNHACAPNCVREQDGRAARGISTRRAAVISPYRYFIVVRNVSYI